MKEKLSRDKLATLITNNYLSCNLFMTESQNCEEIQSQAEKDKVLFKNIKKLN